MATISCTWRTSQPFSKDESVVGATDLRKGFEGLFGLVIGFLTPPLGMNLFVAQGISKQSLENIVKQNMPFLLVLIVVMFITMLFPDIILLLPNYLK